MTKKKNKSQLPIKAPLKDAEQGITSDYIGGDGLDDLLSKLIRSVEVAKASREGLPEKIWMKVVLVAADCNPKWLTKHIPTLASTRQVPVLCLKDNKESSLRLGQVVNVRTALAIGVKARDSIINKAIGEVLETANLVAKEP